MSFIPIDQDSWPRREHFQHYLNRVPCSYSVTVQVDITSLRQALQEQGLKAYPAQIYLLATVVNQFPEFRMSLLGDGQPGYWASVDPMYTVLNQRSETFSAIWTPYHPSFSHFYAACLADIERHATGALTPQAGIPANTFNVSSLPWIDFTAFNLNLYSESRYLLPIFTIGKYIEQAGRTLMPLAIQVHHAACDGLHVGRFVAALRQLASDSDHWG